MDRFTTLSDPNWRKIIERLASRGPLSAWEIGKPFQMNPTAISQHLKVLREANLVRVERGRLSKVRPLTIWNSICARYSKVFNDSDRQ